jgi:hypothetical protein
VQHTTHCAFWWPTAAYLLNLAIVYKNTEFGDQLLHPSKVWSGQSCVTDLIFVEDGCV